METKNLSVQESILIAIVVLVVGLLGVQYSKQKSIERQQVIKIESEQKIEEDRKLDETFKTIRLNTCLEKAETDYWSYMKLNGTENKKDGTVWADNYIWDRADKEKKSDEDACYKQYR